MTFDWSFLEGAVRGGDWLVVMAMLISIGLSAAYCFIIFKLLNLRAIAIPSRFTADFPETVFERAWMDFIKAVTILFRVGVLSIFLIVGLFGALIVSYVLVYLLASRENILQEGFSQEGIWIALFLFGVLPMTVVWLISLYTRDAGWGKWQFFSANPSMGSRPQAAPVMDISRVSPGQLSSLRVMIKLGFAGWILAGAWILLAAGRVFIQAMAATFTMGRITLPAGLLAFSFPTMCGLFLVVSGGFLLLFFRTYLEGTIHSIEFQQNFRIGRIFILMVFVAILTMAGIYHAWPNSIKTIVILILLASTFFFLLSAIDVVSKWTYLSSILFAVFFGMFALSRTGLRIGALPIFFLLAFVYRIIPELLLIAREHRHRRVGATPRR